MFGKKKDKTFNPYEKRADEMTYEVWDKRNHLTEKVKQVITRLGVINLYPNGPDRTVAIADAEKARHAMLVAIGAYDAARMEYNNYIKKYAEKFDNPKREWITTSHEVIEQAYERYNKE